MSLKYFRFFKFLWIGILQLHACLCFCSVSETENDGELIGMIINGRVTLIESMGETSLAYHAAPGLGLVWLHGRDAPWMDGSKFGYRNEDGSWNYMSGPELLMRVPRGSAFTHREGGQGKIPYLIGACMGATNSDKTNSIQIADPTRPWIIHNIDKNILPDVKKLNRTLLLALDLGYAGDWSKTTFAAITPSGKITILDGTKIKPEVRIRLDMHSNGIATFDARTAAQSKIRLCLPQKPSTPCDRAQASPTTRRLRFNATPHQFGDLDNPLAAAQLNSFWQSPAGQSVLGKATPPETSADRYYADQIRKTKSEWPWWYKLLTGTRSDGRGWFSRDN